MTDRSISPLRRRMIEDMKIRGFAIRPGPFRPPRRRAQPASSW